MASIRPILVSRLALFPLAVAADSCLCLVARVRHTSAALLNFLLFKGARKLSRKMRNCRRSTTASGKSSASRTFRFLLFSFSFGDGSSCGRGGFVSVFSCPNASYSDHSAILNTV